MPTVFRSTPKQTELMEAVMSRRYAFIAYGGAMGGGKTYGALAVFQSLALLYPGSKWVVMRESTPTITKTTLPSFDKIKIQSRIKNFNKSKNIVTYDNGSEIHFIAESFSQKPDLEHLKGLECNGFILEQMEELQEATLDICMLRIGRWIIPNAKQPPNFILATLNPAWNWVKRKIYDAWVEDRLPKYETWIDEHGNKQEKLGWRYINAKISDNPVLFNNKTYMANFERLDPITYDRYVNGNWNARDKHGLFIYAFEKEKHVAKRSLFDPNRTDCLTASFDFNVNPATCTVWQIDKQAKNWKDKFIYCIKEFRIENCDVYEMCEAVLNEFPNSIFRITGDASGWNRSHLTKGNASAFEVINNEFNTRRQLLANDVPTVNPSIRDSRLLTNAIFSKYENVLIDPSCVFTIEDLISIKAKPDGSIDKKDLSRGHLLDTVRYLFQTYYEDFAVDYNFNGAVLEHEGFFEKNLYNK